MTLYYTHFHLIYIFPTANAYFKASGFISSYVSVACSKHSGSYTTRDKKWRHSGGGVEKRERLESVHVISHSTQASHVFRLAAVVVHTVHYFAWIS